MTEKNQIIAVKRPDETETRSKELIIYIKKYLKISTDDCFTPKKNQEKKVQEKMM